MAKTEQKNTLPKRILELFEGRPEKLLGGRVRAISSSMGTRIHLNDLSERSHHQVPEPLRRRNRTETAANGKREG